MPQLPAVPAETRDALSEEDEGAGSGRGTAGANVGLWCVFVRRHLRSSLLRRRSEAAITP